MDVITKMGKMSQWSKYALVNNIIINSGNRCSSVGQLAITIMNENLLWIGPVWTKLNEIWIKMNIFFLQNTFENLKICIVNNQNVHYMYFVEPSLCCYGDHFVCALSQCTTMLQCNIISHWLGAYTKWFLCYHCCPCLEVYPVVYVVCNYIYFCMGTFCP